MTERVEDRGEDRRHPRDPGGGSSAAAGSGATGPPWPRALRLTLAYDGGEFHGWQVQPGIATVQGTLLDVCRRVLGGPVKVVGASRTDAGVHALGQVASVWTASRLPAAALARALNALLPAAVRVLGACDAPLGFDARRWAAGKRYLYLLDARPVADPFLRRFSWHVGVGLDKAAMGKALGCLRGRHDFSAFCASPGRDRIPVCDLRSIRLLSRHGRLGILVSADSFLHHMVRNIVGSLVEVGRRARSADWMGEVLEGRDRTRAGPTAPAHGLILLRVMYRYDDGGLRCRPAVEPQ